MIHHLPRGFDYSYLRDVFNIAEDFKSKVIIQPVKLGLLVYVDLVFLSNPKRAIAGVGTTLEDCCEDYMRQARGLELHHVITEKTGTYV